LINQRPFSGPSIKKITHAYIIDEKNSPPISGQYQNISKLLLSKSFNKKINRKIKIFVPIRFLKDKKKIKDKK